MEKKYKLSIVLPTHYTGLVNYASITNALSAAEMYPDDLQVVISDNSNCKEKKNILKSLSSRLRNCKLVSAPLQNNHFHSLSHANSEFCMFAGDDDVIVPEGFDNILRLLDKPEFDAIIGKMGMKIKNSYGFFDYSLLDSNAPECKINGYIGGIKNGNLLFHSIVKTKTMKDAVNLWLSIPNLQHYHDHIKTLFLAINCKWKIYDECYYIYNVGGWKAIEKRVGLEVKYARLSNLPVSIVLLQRLFLAVEGYQLIVNRKGFDKKEAADLWFNAWYDRWVNGIKSNYYNVTEITSCSHYRDALSLIDVCIKQKPVNVGEVFLSIACYFDKVNGTGDKYKNFWGGLSNQKFWPDCYWGEKINT